MGDQRSPTTDFYSIFGLSKAFGKKKLKKNSPSKKNHDPDKEEAVFEAKFEAYKKKQKHEGEPRTPVHVQPRSAVDDSFYQKKSGSLLSRAGSRRSHTPTPRPTYMSKSTSQRSTTPLKNSLSFLSRSISKNSRTKSEMEDSSSSSSSISSKVAPEPDSHSPVGGVPKSPKMSRSTSTARSPDMSRSTSTTRRGPIIYSQTNPARRKPPPVEKKLACTLEDLCFGGVKKIKLRREVFGEDGFPKEEEEMLQIKLKPGWKKGTKITFEGKGNQKPGFLPEDIIFIIEEKKHLLFVREGDDLEIAVEIPLVQALTGCSISVPIIGGEKMSLAFDDVIYPGFEKVIRGQGMPNPRDGGKRGDLRIKFLVNFPTNLTDEQRSEAVSVLQECC